MCSNTWLQVASGARYSAPAQLTSVSTTRISFCDVLTHKCFCTGFSAGGINAPSLGPFISVTVHSSALAEHGTQVYLKNKHHRFCTEKGKKGRWHLMIRFYSSNNMIFHCNCHFTFWFTSATQCCCAASRCAPLSLAAVGRHWQLSAAC